MRQQAGASPDDRKVERAIVFPAESAEKRMQLRANRV
jgi:hypothetical protein